MGIFSRTIGSRCLTLFREFGTRWFLAGTSPDIMAAFVRLSLQLDSPNQNAFTSILKGP